MSDSSGVGEGGLLLLFSEVMSDGEYEVSWTAGSKRCSSGVNFKLASSKICSLLISDCLEVRWAFSGGLASLRCFRRFSKSCKSPGPKHIDEGGSRIMIYTKNVRKAGNGKFGEMVQNYSLNDMKVTEGIIFFTDAGYLRCPVEGNSEGGTTECSCLSTKLHWFKN